MQVFWHTVYGFVHVRDAQTTISGVYSAADKRMGRQMGSDDSRIKAREQAFFLCFSTEFSQTELEEAIEAYSEQEQPSAFALELARGCNSSIEQCDRIIEKYLNKWKLSRVPRASRTLLRLSVYQLVISPDNTAAENPAGVIINDAVRLAKKYATDEDAAFINGVLGSVAKAVQSGRLSAETTEKQETAEQTERTQGADSDE